MSGTTLKPVLTDDSRKRVGEALKKLDDLAEAIYATKTEVAALLDPLEVKWVMVEDEDPQE